MKNLTTFDELITQVDQLQLYSKLIEQLNKDLALANVNLEFELDVLPSSLKLILQENIFILIQQRFIEYLNLLYIIDVSEEQVRELDGNDVVELSKNITFLILKREWQKVYYRNKLSS